MRFRKEFVLLCYQQFLLFFQKYKTMDDESAVLKTFRAYTEAFRKLDPKALLPFYHYPALVIDKDEQPKLLIHSIIGLIGFSGLMRDLRKQGYGYSGLHELSAK